eukprot:68590_1
MNNDMFDGCIPEDWQKNYMLLSCISHTHQLIHSLMECNPMSIICWSDVIYNVTIRLDLDYGLYGLAETCIVISSKFNGKCSSNKFISILDVRSISILDVNAYCSGT